MRKDVRAAGHHVTLPDGSVREATSYLTTPLEIAEGISKRLAADAVVALVEYTEPMDESCAPCVAADGEDDEEEEESQGQLWDLTRPLEGNCKLELIKFDDVRGRDTFWHSSSHVLGAALEDTFGGHLTIGPAVEGGFYYDMYLGEQRLSDANFQEIEKSVAALRQSNAPFERMVISREEALELFAHNPFKVDLIQRKVAPGTMTTAYRCGDLVDLCRGPHLPSTARVKAFKVTKNSSAYWLASADNDSLQRIYGVSFPSEKLLKAHLRRLEEAKERDHRRVGKQQGLFFFDAVVSPGSCFWTSYGARIYNRLQELMRAEYRARGFDEVITPNICSAELFKRSGHYQNYREDMYGFEVEGQEWYLKPMNCPGHCIIFDSRDMAPLTALIAILIFGSLLSFRDVVAVRDGLKSESLTVDIEGEECKEEAQKTRKLLQQLGYLGAGHLDGHHCEWHGVKCKDNCVPTFLECETCSGRLPERINLSHLREVKLTSPNLTGDINVFQETPYLRRLFLHGTQVHGNLSALANLELLHLDLSGTAVTGSLKDLAGEVDDEFSDWSLNNMERLSHLLLNRTKETGDLSTLRLFGMIEVADLSHTAVSGWITEEWKGSLRSLEILKLQNTSVQFVPGGRELERLKVSKTRSGMFEALLDGLKELDLSNSPVNSPAESVLLPLAMSEKLTSIQAAGTGIYGEMPKLTDTEARINGKNISNFTFPLAKSLVMLDLCGNNVTGVHDLPVQPNIGRMLLRENHHLNVDVKVFAEALKQQVFLDLSGTTLSNQDEAAELLKEGVMKTTDMHAFRDETAGYACKDVIGTVKVTPRIFLPQELCKCLSGWYGSGATCAMCPSNKFSDDLGFDTCKSCPPNSTAPAGSTKMADCKCRFGDLHEGVCACDTHHALQKGDCTLCTKLHLQCEAPGSLASTAVPDMDYSRLDPNAEEAHRCLPPAVSDRCPGSHQCGLGYNGTLCSSCADGFWATRGKCEPCAEASSTSIASLVLLGVGGVLAAAFLIHRHVYGQQVPEAASVMTLLQKLMARQGPVVLQLLQLWSVLSRLGQHDSSSAKSLPEIPYLETQLLLAAYVRLVFAADAFAFLPILKVCIFQDEVPRVAWFRSGCDDPLDMQPRNLCS
eukprot:s59_g53.t1